MDITQAYAIGFGGFLCLLILIHFRQWLLIGWRKVIPLSLKYFVYPQIRHRLTGAWQPAGVIAGLLYGGVNVFCVCFKVRSVWMAGLRAANLSLINLIPLMAGPHLSFPSDLLGITLRTYRRFHRSLAVISSILLCFHVLTVLVEKKPFHLRISENLFGLIGAISWGFLVPLSHPLLRRPSYEFFLRVHQILAIVVTYSIWAHLRKSPSLPQKYIYITIGTFLLTILVQCGLIMYQTGVFGSGLAKVKVTNVKEMLAREHVIIGQEVVTLQVRLASPLQVKPGQYICLWIPWFGRLQSHPFMITSWSDESLESLNIFVEPRDGLTRKLLRYSDSSRERGTLYNALFSGPHGITVPAGNYETVLMMADGFGIVSHLSYLKQLIHGYNACRIRTRRIHLVWQLETKVDLGYAATDLLNDALVGDTLSVDIGTGDINDEESAKGKILSISVYIHWARQDRVPFGSGRRAIAYSGLADVEAIFKEEAAGKHIKRVQEESGERGEMLVMVSGSNDLRDRLRRLVRPLADKKVRLEELEYQPGN
ncbi:FAD-binding domain-containing protein [Cladophialophora immunda]|nr:FAD-binding domain-containing protein [Cladophialophora immunda]